MSLLFLTIAIAFIIVVLALVFMAIGWLLTGRSKLHPGACGRNPHQKRNEKEGCGTGISCSLCEKEDHDPKNGNQKGGD